MGLSIRSALKPMLVALPAAALIAAACASSAGADKKPVAMPAPVPAPTTTEARTPPGPPPSPSTKRWTTAPAMAIDVNKKYTATITTSKGVITAELYAKDTPVTVNNFVFLAKQNFYDGVIFHRIIKGFMVQTGDPVGNGTGSPGYQFRDEPVTKPYARGTLAMANSGPNTNGSQFFMMHADYGLSPNYTIFGKVTSGLDVLDAIANTPVKASSFSSEASQPTETVRITSVTIAES